MAKLIYSAITSLDGYVADEHGLADVDLAAAFERPAERQLVRVLELAARG